MLRIAEGFARKNNCFTVNHVSLFKHIISRILFFALLPQENYIDESIFLIV